MANKESKKRISYVKPEALDLGSVASIMGTDGVGSCVTGEDLAAGGCLPTGNAAATGCVTGNSAIQFCDAGNAGSPP